MSVLGKKHNGLSPFLTLLLSITINLVLSTTEFLQYGVMNNACYANILEDCRSEAFRSIGFDVNLTAQNGECVCVLLAVHTCKRLLRWRLHSRLL